MTNAICTVNNTVLPTTGTTGINVGAGTAVQIALLNIAGVVSWSLACTNYDGYNTNGLPATINAGLTINQTTYTASFTAPAMVGSAGSALQFTSIVNQGRSDQNTFTFGIFVLNSNGTRFFFGGESFESNATVGCAFDLNTLVFNSVGDALVGDVTGPTSNTTLISISGASPIPITPAILQFKSATSGPTINQANLTTASGAGQTLTIQAQNETGTTSTGGNLALSSGTGTSTNGSVNIQTGGSNNLIVGPTFTTIGAIATNTSTNFDVGGITNLSLTSGQLQWAASVGSPTINVATTSTGVGSTFTIQAQGATGASHTGGQLVLAGGTSGSSTAGTVVIQTAGATRLTAGATGVITIANLSTGLVHADSSGNLTSSSVVNADISPGTSAQVLMTNATPATAWTSFSGDVTVSATGATTVNTITGSSPVSITPNISWLSTSTPQILHAAPASSTGNGTSANQFKILMGDGGATTGSGTTGGNGANGLIASGSGGSGSGGTNANGGTAGNLTITTGVGGAASGSGTAGGNGTVIIQTAGINTMCTFGGAGLQLGGGNVALTTGNTVLTAAQAAFPVIKFTGSLSGNCNIAFPSTSGGTWIVDASAVTLNSHTITVSANANNWATTIGITNTYLISYSTTLGKLLGITLSP